MSAASTPNSALVGPGFFARAIDALVGAFSPASALRRQAARSAMYAAAKTTRMTGDWSPAEGSVNDIIGNSSAAVRARIRQLVRDMPYFARAVDVVTDYTVGDGIRFQSRVKAAGGKLARGSIQKIEDAASRWMETADIAGKLHYYEMMQLAKRQDLECGEFLIIKTVPKDRRGRSVPYALQMVEADWLTSLNTVALSPASKIDQGIEYDAATGEVIAYHVADPWGWGRAQRVAAADVIHNFKTLRPGQRRGISPFVPGVLMARDLDDLMTAELDAAKMAARYLAFVQTPDPSFRQAAVGAAVNPDTGKKIEEMEHAIIEYLRPGEQVSFAKSERPGTNFPPFVRLVLTMFAVTTGAPYELLSGDYQGLNFSTAKINRNDFANFLRPVASRHIRHFCQPTMAGFFTAAAASGALEMPGYFADPAHWLAAAWQPPGMEPVDPLREVKSNLDEMSVALRTPQEIVGARGRDLEEVYDEFAEALRLAKEKGIEISLQRPSTAQANNPAAVDDQKSALEFERLVTSIVAGQGLLQEGYA